MVCLSSVNFLHHDAALKEMSDENGGLEGKGYGGRFLRHGDTSEGVWSDWERLGAMERGVKLVWLVV